MIKVPRDGNIQRVFKEFVLGWKAFLRGVSPPHLLFGPFLIRPRITLLKELGKPCVLALAKEIEEKIKILASASIEHRELRHPESHVGLWRGKIVFIDFDRGRISRKSRDLNKFRAWLQALSRPPRPREKARPF